MSHIEHFSAEIDIVEHDDGTWRADKYPRTGGMVSSAKDDYPSRRALLIAWRELGTEFWESPNRSA